MDNDHGIGRLSDIQRPELCRCIGCGDIGLVYAILVDRYIVVRERNQIGLLYVEREHKQPGMSGKRRLIGHPWAAL